MSKKVLIVGSGPSGVAAAMKLQNLGIDAVMIDSDLKASDDFFRDEFDVNQKKKLLFGSDYPYRHFKFGPKIVSRGSSLPFSFTQGGLSTIWGASFLPFSMNDILNWPIDLNGLKKGYEFIAKRLPIASCSQRPLFSYENYQNQRQISADTVFRYTDKLFFENDLLDIGGSRLAVRSGSGQGTDCTYCGKCLWGCTYGSIWSSRDELESLIKSGLIYISGERVLSVKVNEENLSVKTVSKNGEEKQRDGFSRIFLACGNIETFRILAESKAIEDQVEVQHSTTFYFPSLVIKKGLRNSNNFALAQAFIRLQNESRESEMHFQMYSLSQQMLDSLAIRFPLMNFLPGKVRSFLVGKVIVCIGYCRSEKYSNLQFARVKNGDCEVRGEFVSTKRNIKKSLGKKIWKSRVAFKAFGLIPLPNLIILDQPGDGVHAGGWLAIGEKSDLMGSPLGFMGVHVIDSSVLPSIPDGPITFAIMANAVRIISEIYE